MDSSDKKKEKSKKENIPSFDDMMKALLSVPPKENKDIQEKTKKERKPKKKSAE